MTKGERMKRTIAAATAPLFNRQGFAGASMTDIMAATGLGKGGIYNHFRSKEELAVAAFDFSVALIRDRLDAALENKDTAADRLLAMAQVFALHVTNPPVPGGCPLFNTAVDSDDTHPEMRDRAREALDRWHNLVRGTVRKGIARGEFRPDIDVDTFATLFIASLEGGIALSRLNGTEVHIQRVLAAMAREIRNMTVRA